MTVQSNEPASSEVLVPNTILQYKEPFLRTSPAVYWLRFGASTAGGTGSILGRRPRILNAEGHGQKNKKIEPFLPGGMTESGAGTGNIQDEPRHL